MNMIDRKEFQFKKPEKKDGAFLHYLVSECPPLDLNSMYAYFLVSTHFSETSIIVFKKGAQEKTPVGMISAYVLPENPTVLFIWQVAVLKDYRKKDIAKTMFKELLKRPGLGFIKYVHTTIAPENRPSRRLFRYVADYLETKFVTQKFLKKEDFLSLPNMSNGGHSRKNKPAHDEEELIKIGPIKKMPIS